MPENFDASQVADPFTRPWYKHWWGILLIILFVLIAASVIFFASLVWAEYRDIKSGALPPDATGAVYDSARPNPTKLNNVSLVPDDAFVLGPANAPVQLVEFSDFQCPICRAEAPILRKLLFEYGDKIQFVYRDFPIIDAHPVAVLAARAARCAGEQGMFLEYHDRLFQMQELISPQNLVIFALQIGLDEMAFATCLDSERYQAEVMRDFRDGFALDVTGTPTFFINGQRFAGLRSEEELRAIIEAVLRQRGL